ncbi:hypothetical protein CYMTET_26354 [Cymbomonas tetramitiformis]|uniref:Uncharacterized protein n=1 Tax=Cymbomonas tetramitiformis TaxID=36881 RepID=A0AAE0FTH0_9CHLO|nr:hypothetical protein CYMTET_26354 [Cymbomonas tetramitiformis]
MAVVRARCAEARQVETFGECTAREQEAVGLLDRRVQALWDAAQRRLGQLEDRAEVWEERSHARLGEMSRAVAAEQECLSDAQAREEAQQQVACEKAAEAQEQLGLLKQCLLRRGNVAACCLQRYVRGTLARHLLAGWRRHAAVKTWGNRMSGRMLVVLAGRRASMVLQLWADSAALKLRRKQLMKRVLLALTERFAVVALWKWHGCTQRVRWAGRQTAVREARRRLFLAARAIKVWQEAVAEHLEASLQQSAVQWQEVAERLAGRGAVQASSRQVLQAWVQIAALKHRLGRTMRRALLALTDRCAAVALREWHGCTQHVRWAGRQTAVREARRRLFLAARAIKVWQDAVAEHLEASLQQSAVQWQEVAERLAGRGAVQASSRHVLQAWAQVAALKHRLGRTMRRALLALTDRCAAVALREWHGCTQHVRWAGRQTAVREARRRLFLAVRAIKVWQEAVAMRERMQELQERAHLEASLQQSAVQWREVAERLAGRGAVQASSRHVLQAWAQVAALKHRLGRTMRRALLALTDRCAAVALREWHGCTQRVRWAGRQTAVREARRRLFLAARAIKVWQEAVAMRERMQELQERAHQKDAVQQSAVQWQEVAERLAGRSFTSGGQRIGLVLRWWQGYTCHAVWRRCCTRRCIARRQWATLQTALLALWDICHERRTEEAALRGKVRRLKASQCRRCVGAWAQHAVLARQRRRCLLSLERMAEQKARAGLRRQGDEAFRQWRAWTGGRTHRRSAAAGLVVRNVRRRVKRVLAAWRGRTMARGARRQLVHHGLVRRTWRALTGSFTCWGARCARRRALCSGMAVLREVRTQKLMRRAVLTWHEAWMVAAAWTCTLAHRRECLERLMLRRIVAAWSSWCRGGVLLRGDAPRDSPVLVCGADRWWEQRLAGAALSAWRWRVAGAQAEQDAVLGGALRHMRAMLVEWRIAARVRARGRCAASARAWRDAQRVLGAWRQAQGVLSVHHALLTRAQRRRAARGRRTVLRGWAEAYGKARRARRLARLGARRRLEAVGRSWLAALWWRVERSQLIIAAQRRSRRRWRQAVLRAWRRAVEAPPAHISSQDCSDAGGRAREASTFRMRAAFCALAQHREASLVALKADVAGGRVAAALMRRARRWQQSRVVAAWRHWVDCARLAVRTAAAAQWGVRQRVQVLQRVWKRWEGGRRLAAKEHAKRRRLRMRLVFAEWRHVAGGALIRRQLAQSVLGSTPKYAVIRAMGRLLELLGDSPLMDRTPQDALWALVGVVGRQLYQMRQPGKETLHSVAVELDKLLVEDLVTYGDDTCDQSEATEEGAFSDMQAALGPWAVAGGHAAHFGAEAPTEDDRRELRERSYGLTGISRPDKTEVGTSKMIYTHGVESAHSIPITSRRAVAPAAPGHHDNQAAPGHHDNQAHRWQGVADTEMASMRMPVSSGILGDGSRLHGLLSNLASTLRSEDVSVGAASRGHSAAHQDPGSTAGRNPIRTNLHSPLQPRRMF